jgi:SEC-C motif-containing protein
MSVCPCGSGRPPSDCCAPYLEGKSSPPTAEALMRARYCAYVAANVDFIERTQAKDTREAFDREATTRWAKDSEWKGLEIVSVEDGGERDTTGVVRFVAQFIQQGKSFRHEEIAEFRKDGGAWLFVEGKLPKGEPYVKTGPELGRNDPCHCGSGKKYKKCHGR